jgi:hypothetical protein
LMLRPECFAVVHAMDFFQIEIMQDRFGRAVRNGPGFAALRPAGYSARSSA